MTTRQTMKSCDKKSPPSEHAEQVTLVKWLSISHPTVRIFAIPNGGRRGKLEAMRLQLEGVSPGVPDLMLPTPRGQHHGLFVEMKRTKGSSVSKEQKDWIAYLQAQGYQAIVCRGFEEAKREIECYLSTTS